MLLRDIWPRTDIMLHEAVMLPAQAQDYELRGVHVQLPSPQVIVTIFLRAHEGSTITILTEIRKGTKFFFNLKCSHSVTFHEHNKFQSDVLKFN